MGTHEKNRKIKEREASKSHDQASNRADEYVTPVGSTTARPHADEGMRRADEERNVERQLRVAKTLNLITGIGTIVALLGLIFLYLQLRATQKSANAAESAAETAKRSLDSSYESFKQEVRPYVWADSFNMSNPPLCRVPGKPRVCADVHVVNSGRTPAIGIHLYAYATFGPDAEATVRAMKIPSYTKPLGPILGTVGDKWKTAETGPVNDSRTLNDILTGKTPLYLYGVVQYFDIFGRYHESGFCNLRLPDNGPFMSCPFGNWFDKRSDGKRERDRRSN